MSGKRFRVEPYEWTVHFYTDRVKWARATSRRKFGPFRELLATANDSTGICSVDANANSAYVGVFNGMVGTLAHEMTHAAMRILGGAGVKISPDNNEALAYLIGHMVDECEPSLMETLDANA